MGILSTNSFDIESTGLTIRRFKSLEASEQAANQLGRYTQFRQLDKGSIETASQFFRIGPISYLMQQSSRKVESVGEFPDSFVSFVFPIGSLFWINGVNLTINEGVVVSENAEIHTCNIACDSAFSVVLPLAYFTTVLNVVAPDSAELTPGRLVPVRGSEGFTVQLLADLMRLEKAKHGSNLSVSLQGEITTILAMLVSASLDKTESPGYHFKERRRILSRAIEYIAASLTRPLAFPDMCNAVGVGKRKLERIFAMELQITPTDFILARRLDLARRKLMDVENRHNISEIASECGFGHFGRFSGAYKSQFGISPRRERTGRRTSS